MNVTAPNSSYYNLTNYGHVALVTSVVLGSVALAFFLKFHGSPTPTALLATGSSSFLVASLMLYGGGLIRKPQEEETSEDPEEPTFEGPVPQPKIQPVVIEPVYRSTHPDYYQASGKVSGNEGQVPKSELNASIFEETEKICKTSGYNSPKGFGVPVDTQNVVEGTKCFKGTVPKIPIDAWRCAKGTCLTVVEGNTVDEAIRVANITGQIPAALSMADPRVKGGGVAQGADTQETEIIRRTNLILSLDEAEKNAGYPFKRRGLIYSEHIQVFRDSKGTLLDRTYEISILSVPALNLTTEGKNDLDYLGFRGPISELGLKVNKKYMNDMCRTIRNLLRVAYQHGHRHIVLEALGCKNCGHPPELVAGIFAKALNSEEFKDVFESVTFAIGIDHKNPEGQARGMEIFKAFNKKFKSFNPSPRRQNNYHL